MSFLDHLAKNLNTQTEFFTQLSNISRDSRAKTVSRPELELKQKTSLNVEKRSPTESNRANEKEDFKVEKEDFFTTAKKVFQEYKIKADRKTQDKKEPKLQEELETAVKWARTAMMDAVLLDGILRGYMRLRSQNGDVAFQLAEGGHFAN